MTIVLLLPILLPLLMLPVEAFLLARLQLTIWRPFVRGFMLLAIGCIILLIPSITPAGVSYTLGLPGLVFLPPLALLYTSTGTIVSVLFLASNMITFLNLTRDEQLVCKLLRWLAISLVITACQAANVYTETLAWFLLGITLLGIDFSENAYEPQLTHWFLLGELVPLTLLLIVTLSSGLLASQNSFTDLINSPTLGVLLVAAAILRMPIYPLPGYYRKNWFRFFANSCAGAALYLKIASLSASALPVSTIFITILAGCAMIPAVIANITPLLESKIWFVSISLAAAMVIAPLLDPGPGSGLAVLYLGLILLLPPVISFSGEFNELSRKTIRRILTTAALVQLMGVPLSLGLATRWDLQYLIGTEYKLAILLLTLANLFTTLSLWASLRALWRRTQNENEDIPGKNTLGTRLVWVGWGLTGLAVAWTGVVGVFPAFVNYLLVNPLTFPSSSNIFKAGIAVWIYPLVTTVIIPLAGAFFILQQEVTAERYKSTLLEIEKFLQLRWFYGGVTGLMTRVSHLLERAIQFIETRFLLGWEIAWMLLVIIIRANN